MNKSLDRTSSFLTTSPWTLVSPEIPYLQLIRKGQKNQNKTGQHLFSMTFYTHNDAIPAFRTAEEIAFTAV